MFTRAEYRFHKLVGLWENFVLANEGNPLAIDGFGTKCAEAYEKFKGDPSDVRKVFNTKGWEAVDITHDLMKKIGYIDGPLINGYIFEASGEVVHRVFGVPSVEDVKYGKKVGFTLKMLFDGFSNRNHEFPQLCDMFWHRCRQAYLDAMNQ